MTQHDPLRDLWATDEGDKFTMSIAELNARADQFRARVKRRNLTEHLAAVLVIFMFGAIAFLVPVLSLRLGAGLIILATLYVSWRLHAVASSSSGPALGDNLSSVHRRELVRQRDALKSVWRWYLLPFVPGVLVLIVGTAIEGGASQPLWAVMQSCAISLGFVAAVFGGVWAINAFAAKRLDDDVRALDAMSIANGGVD